MTCFTQISFNWAVVRAKGGIVEKLGLKTQKRRSFPCNGKMREFLASTKPENYKPDNLVSPAPSGGFMNVGNFRNHIWEPVLSRLAIEYRKPYQTTHTFITLALDNGLNIKDVAGISGNSPKVILDHYAGNKRDSVVPEF